MTIDNSLLSMYHGEMIDGFRHKGLRLLFEDGNRSKVKASDVRKIERILVGIGIRELENCFPVRGCPCP